MTWTKLSDDFTDDPDLLALPRTVRLVHIEAMVWSNRHGTDGHIPAHALPRVTDDPDASDAAEHLVAAGKWKPVETGWEVVGFLDDQPAADDVNRTKELARARQRRQRQHRNGDHSLCDPRYCNVASRAMSRDTSRVTNAVSHDTPTRPDPSRPEGSRDGAGLAHADACQHRRRTADGDCLDCDAVVALPQPEPVTKPDIASGEAMPERTLPEPPDLELEEMYAEDEAHA